MFFRLIYTAGQVLYDDSLGGIQNDGGAGIGSVPSPVHIFSENPNHVANKRFPTWIKHSGVLSARVQQFMGSSNQGKHNTFKQTKIKVRVGGIKWER